jgi:aryl-alcohol dehydrogenase-like predicted oxidoreductase
MKKFGWKRSDIVVSTKLYWGGANGNNPVNNNGLSRKRIVEDINASLERLQLSYIDLVYADRPDCSTPIEETVRAFIYVINQGKAFCWGTSEWNQDEIAAAWRCADKLALIGPLMEQSQYSMLCRARVEFDYISLLKEIGLGLAIISPLKAGIFDREIQHWHPARHPALASRQRPLHQSPKGTLRRRGLEKRPRDREEAGACGGEAGHYSDELTQTNLAYAWVLRNLYVDTALTGASRPEQVYECVKAMDALKLLMNEVKADLVE